MGTPAFAVASLKSLLQTEHKVVAVVTSPDKPAGRGRKIKESAVKKFALEKGLNILQPRNLKSPEFIESLAGLKADLQIVVAFRMLPKSVWEMPPLGTFNLHASLLPNYRGAAPINWAIINGETRTGVTTFFINEDIDTGALLKQESVEIFQDQTAGELHDQLMELGARTVVQTVDMISAKNVKPRKQKAGDFKTAPKLNKDNCRIQWNQSIDQIYNLVRGLNPYPAAWTFMDNEGQRIELKIYKVEKVSGVPDIPPGHLKASKKKLRIAAQNGYLDILDLKLAGKRRMDVVSLLNGYHFTEGAYMY